MDINQYITAKEAAEIAGMRLDAFRKWVIHNRAPQPVEISKRVKLYVRAEIEAWKPDKQKRGAKKKG